MSQKGNFDRNIKSHWTELEYNMSKFEGCRWAVQREKFIALNANSRKEEKSQINKLSSYLKNLDLRWANSTKVNGRKKIINVRAEISKTKIQKRQTEKNRKKRKSMKKKDDSFKKSIKLTNL